MFFIVPNTITYNCSVISRFCVSFIFPFSRQSLIFVILPDIGNGRFSYKDIYPCSCNLLGHPLPCSICNSNPKLTTESSLLSKNSQISLYSSVHGNGEGSRGHLTPLEFHTLQPTKKTSYLFFLDALRERVINDICEHSQSLGTVARRLDNGIIWGLPGSCKDWGTGWEHHAHYR